MSKLRPDKINYDNDDFLIELSAEDIHHNISLPENQKENEQPDENIADVIEEKERILSEANKEAEAIIKQADEIKEKAESEAKVILEDANKQALELLENSKAELEKQITSSAHEGYNAGYNDGLEKVKEELTSKIEDFDKFCDIQSNVKNKILKSATKEILNIIVNISKKILLKEVNCEVIKNILDKTISLLEDKEEVTIILSEKYAKLLYELQNNSLTEEKEFTFENFNQYKGFKIIYNAKFDDDTIIVETPKERFDASITSQVDIIIRNIYDNIQGETLSHTVEQQENES